MGGGGRGGEVAEKSGLGCGGGLQESVSFDGRGDAALEGFPGPAMAVAGDEVVGCVAKAGGDQAKDSYEGKREAEQG